MGRVQSENQTGKCTATEDAVLSDPAELRWDHSKNGGVKEKWSDSKHILEMGLTGCMLV